MVEPALLQITENKFEKMVGTAMHGWMSLIKDYGIVEKTFFNIRIAHPTSQYYSARSIS